jgi:hypothetical protein
MNANCEVETLCLLVHLSECYMGFHVGLLEVFLLVDVCWTGCPCLPLAWGRLPVEAWASINADGLHGKREGFEDVALEGRAPEVVDSLFGKRWVAGVDVEGSADLGRVPLLLLRAPGDNEDVDGVFGKWRVAEGERIAARLRVVTKELRTLGTREDEEEDAMSVATGDTVGIFGCDELGGPDRDAPGSSGVEIVYCVVS